MNLPTKSKWTITVYNILGRKVKEFSGESDAGEINVVWEAGDFASGVYFYKAKAGSFSATKKMLMIK